MLKQAVLLILLFSFGSVLYCFGQEITVYDQVTQQPVPGAKIYSNQPKIQLRTNAAGKFQLEIFAGCDSVYVSYTNYKTRGFAVEQLKSVTKIALEDEALSVSEMTVTANRWEQDEVEIPNRITKLNIKDIDLLAPQTSADLLESSGYVFVQKSQLAGGSPQMRGFGTNQVLIVVDGVRMNNAIFRSGNLQNVIALDVNSLESAEVIFGPGAVMYGSDAIGGVMDFSTKAAKLSLDSNKTKLKTNIFSRYSTASNEITSHFDFNIGKKKWAFLTAATYSRFDDLKAGEFGNDAYLRPTYQERINGIDSTLENSDPRLQVNSGYSQLNAIQKIKFKPNEKWLFDYGFNFSTTSDAPRYDRLILDGDNDGKLDYAEWYYGPQQWMMNRLTIVNSPVKKVMYNKLRIVAAHQNYKESRHDRKTGSSAIRRQFESVDAFSLNIDLDKEFSSRASFFYGFEGIVNRVGSRAYREPIDGGDQLEINSRYPDGSIWQAYGVYTNLKYAINEKWIFNTGMRFSIYHIQAKFDTTLFAFPESKTTNSNNALNGSLGLVFNPNERTQFYINASTGFRAPNIDDVGKVFDSEPGNVVVPNVDLKPEYAYNGEVGFMKAIKNQFKIDGAVYFTYLKDALARANYSFNGQDSIFYEGELSKVQAVQNLSNAYVYGVQGGIELVLGKGLTLKSTISYQKGFEYNIDSAAYYPKPNVAPMFGRTSISYKTRHLRVEFYAVYHDRVDYEEFPLLERDESGYALNNDGLPYTPSWYTLNIKGSYFFNKSLSMNVGLENITNQLYRTFGSGISASGRNFLISLKASF